MTCIVATTHKGKIYIGADSCSSNGRTQGTNSNPKVFLLGNEAIIGGAGSWRLIDILQYAFIFPHHDPSIPIDRYMRTAFIADLKRLMGHSGYGTMLPHTEHHFDSGEFIIGYKKKLYTIQGDFSVLNSENFGIATGSGEVAARGSLYTSYSDKKLYNKPKERLLLALEAAEAIAVGVRRPFKILEL